jgi:hypothetical protein
MTDWFITADDLERAHRITQNPFDSDEVRLFLYAKPVASDDGLFKHRDGYVLCFGCQPDPTTGECAGPHLHIVLEGANVGIRCEPLCITPIAQDYLSRGGADALETLVEGRLLFPAKDGD